MNNRELIEAPIIRLIKEEPFFTYLLLQMKLHITSTIPTAGVNITNTVNLFINPEFFKQMTLKEQVAVLKHEALHIVFNHLGRATDISTSVAAFNMPADIAINQLIPNIPQTLIIDGKECKSATYENALENYPDLDPKESAEYYYYQLKNNQDKQSGEGSGDGMNTIDNHDLWKEGCQDPEIIKERIKEIVNKAAEQARQAGNIPGQLEIAIEALNKNTKNWKSDLRRFVANTSEILIEKSRKVRDRRYGIIFPGDKKESKLKLAIAVDTSASVSNEELMQFFAEIDNICHNNTTVTIIEADCEVGKVYDYKPKMKLDITGRGGTMYQPAIDKANELDVDGLIYFGDMEVFDEKLNKPKFPVLWAIVGDAKQPATWGWNTKIEVKK